MKKADNHIEILNLELHIEGGYFREIYTCSEKINDRSIASSIYFLLKQGDFSAFHIIGQDEQWVHIDGGAMYIHMINKSGKYSYVKVGTDYEKGEVPSFVVPANTYFASEPVEGYSLVVCNVFPSFSYEDFILVKREDFINQFSEHKELILRLTR